MLQEFLDNLWPGKQKRKFVKSEVISANVNNKFLSWTEYFAPHICTKDPEQFFIKIMYFSIEIIMIWTYIFCKYVTSVREKML